MDEPSTPHDTTSPFNTDGRAATRRRRDDHGDRGHVGDRVTLVNGRTFTVADGAGELTSRSNGTIFEDLRMLSHLTVSTGGNSRRELLASSTPTPFHAVVVSRPEPTDSEPRQIVVHRQWIGRGVRHDIEIHNTDATELSEAVTVEVDTDFAHIFDVKNAVATDGRSNLEWADDRGRLVDPGFDGHVVDVRTSPAPTEVDADRKALGWNVRCPAHSIATISVSFEPVWDGVAAGLAFPLATPPARSVPAMRHDDWHRSAPSVDSDDDRLSTAFDVSLADLASLRIFDPSHPDRTVVAAGAPWFMTLFGRDSLLTSWMTLPFVPELALGVLAALADLQGTQTVPDTEEEPGKIIHELRRHGGDDAFADRGRYYGTVDATPLFVMVAAEARRWGHLRGEHLEALWPSVRAAIDWVSRSIECDPTGWLRYERSTPTGLINQGWKDSWDGITFADGRIPTGPIALSEAQGYAYAALRDGAEVARLVADPGVDADELDRQADRLRQRYEDRFWMEASSSYALAIADDDTLVDSVTTNPGHSIWAGIADPDRANRYLDRILDDDLFTGWGLRTLSPTSAAYNPLSYHNGSVWPHDTALVVAGAGRLGRYDAAMTIADGALDTASRFGGRPPELFAGVDRGVIDTPVSYPDSCSPQAWASASTLLNLRTVLGLQPPERPGGHLVLDPDSPAAADLGIRSVAGVRVGDDRLDIEPH